MKAHEFDLPGVDGKRHTLASARGRKAGRHVHLQPLPVREGGARPHHPRLRRAEEQGIGSIAMMSNDPSDYPEDSFDNMKRIAHGEAFSVSVRARRNPGHGPRLRRRVHAGILRFRLERSSCSTTAGWTRRGASVPNARRELYEAMVEIARSRKRAEGAASLGRLLDQVAHLENRVRAIFL